MSIEEIAFLVVLGLVFVAAFFVPQYEIPYLLFVFLPIMLWYASFVYRDEKRIKKE